MQDATVRLKFSEIDDFRNEPNLLYRYTDEMKIYYVGKKVRKENFIRWKNDLNELRMSRSHQNIQKYFAGNETTFKVVGEYCDGTLQEYIQKPNNVPFFQKDKPQPLSYKDFFPTKNYDSDLPLNLDLLHQIAHGLKFLHDNSISHGNIQPSNIYLTRTGTIKEKTVAKLGFFGVAANWKGDLFDCDIFGFGMLVFYTLTEGKYPFGDSDTSDWQENWKTLEENSLVFTQAKLDKAMTNRESSITAGCMIKQIIHPAVITKKGGQEERSRVTIDDVIHHPIFYGPTKKLEFLLKVQTSFHKLINENDKNCKKLKKEIEQLTKNYKFASNKVFKEHKYLTSPVLNENDGVYMWKKYKQKKKLKECKWNKHYDDCNECDSLKTLLLALRNKVAHACHYGFVPIEFRDNFGITYDSFNAKSFVEIFVTKPNPKLLIKLYQCYKKSNTGFADSFFPN